MTISEMCGRDSKRYFACEFGYIKLIVLGSNKTRCMVCIWLSDMCIVFVRLTV